MNSTRIRGPIGITAHPEADGIVDGQIAPCQPPERVGRDASLPTPRRFEPRSRVHRVAPRGATPPKRTGWTTWPWRSDPQPDPGDPMTDLRRPAAVWPMEEGPSDEPAPSHPTAPTGFGGQDASGVDAFGRPAAVASDVGRVPHERIPARRTTVAGGTNRVDSPRRSERTRRRGVANPRLVESANPVQVCHVRRAGRDHGLDDPGSDELDSEGVGWEYVVPTRHPPIGFRRHEWSPDETNRAARAA